MFRGSNTLVQPVQLMSFQFFIKFWQIIDVQIQFFIFRTPFHFYNVFVRRWRILICDSWNIMISVLIFWYQIKIFFCLHLTQSLISTYLPKLSQTLTWKSELKRTERLKRWQMLSWFSFNAPELLITFTLRPWSHLTMQSSWTNLSFQYTVVWANPDDVNSKI